MIKKPSTKTAKALIICAFSTLFYVYEFFLRVAPSAMTHELMHDFSMNASTLGLMAACFYYGYAPMQVPAGLLLDRYGPRCLLTASIAACGFSTLLFSLTHTVALLSATRFLIGAASAFAYIAPLMLVMRWLPTQYFAMTTGLVQFMGCMGAIVGEAPVALLVERFDWRPTLFGAACIGLVITLLFWFIIRDYPEDYSIDLKVIASQATTINEWKRLRMVVRNPQTWAAGCCGFACWAPIAIFAELWGVPFLMETYHTNAAIASAATSIIWIGIAIGGPLMGAFSDAIGSRRIPLLCGYSLALFSAMGMIYLHNLPWLTMDALLFCFGFAASTQVVSFGAVKDNNPHHIAGTAIGFNNMAVILGGILLQPLIGLILHHFWSGHTHLGIPTYSIASYEKAMIFIPLCASLGLITALFFLKETHCKNTYEEG